MPMYHDAQRVLQREFLATADPSGQPTCSYKGGEPGFIAVPDPGTIIFPWYDGNGMFLSAGNVAAASPVGILLIDFEAGKRLRIEGDAVLWRDPVALRAWPGALFLMRVAVGRVYPNCPRYIHHYQLVERSAFVPHAGVVPPVPAWKRAEWAADVLPKGDPARLPGPP